MKVNSNVQAPVILFPEKQPPVLLVWEAGWAIHPVWALWKRGKSLAFAGN
jgi:hypothetical protein